MSVCAYEGHSISFQPTSIVGRYASEFWWYVGLCFRLDILHLTSECAFVCAYCIPVL